jgi:cGMP-dependent protein kinase
MLLALEHLAERRIVHRDLKPENTMVDEDGYPKIIDFGTAKLVKSRTYTIIGTPHYMAPEILTGRGYNTSVDVWSLGAMLYEFL